MKINKFNMAIQRLKFRNTLKGVPIEVLKVMKEEINRALQERSRQ